MKAVLLLGVICALAAVSYSRYCGGAMMNDPSACTHTCPLGERKTCEHGGICTCAVECGNKDECMAANVTCAGMQDPHTGHMIREEVHCFDGLCICIMMHGGMLPGGVHGQHGGHSG